VSFFQFVLMAQVIPGGLRMVFLCQHIEELIQDINIDIDASDSVAERPELKGISKEAFREYYEKKLKEKRNLDRILAKIKRLKKLERLLILKKKQIEMEKRIYVDISKKFGFKLE
jgi:hypothetical protein